MAAISAQIQQWIDHHGEWFERAVLWHATFNPSMMPKLAPILCINRNGEYVNDFTSPIYGGYYVTIRDHILSGRGGVISQPVAHVLLSSAAAAGLVLSPGEGANAMQVYEILAGTSLADLEGCVTEGLAYWLGKRRTASVTQRVVGYNRTWNADELVAGLGDELSFVNQSLNPVSHHTEFAAGVFSAKPRHVDCISTGLHQLDRQLGGGLHRKDGTLGIAAPGVGKTVFALNLAAHAAINGYVVAFITTEQPEEQLTPRIVSAKADILFSKIARGFHLQMLEPKEFSRTMQIVNKMKGNLHFFDWNLNRKSIEGGGIQEELDTVIRLRGKVDLLVLDWLGGGLTADARSDKDKKRLAMQNGADMVAQVAMDYNIASVAMAQAHKKDGVNNPMVGVGDCTDCKTLDQKMVNVIGITGMFQAEAKKLIAEGKDPVALGLFADKQFFFVSKARHSTGGHAMWKRNFKYMRMENWYD